VLAIAVKTLEMPAFANREKLERGWVALRHPHLVFGIIAIFMYVGAEVAIGSFLVKFFTNENVAAMPKATGNKFLAYYWGGLMIGRLLGAVSLGNMRDHRGKYAIMALISVIAFGFIYVATSIQNDSGRFFFDFLHPSEITLFALLLVLNYVGFILGRSTPARSLAVFAVVNIVLLVVASLGGGGIAFWAAIGTGLFNSIMWSNIFTLAIKDLGKYTSQGSSLLIMAIVGGAIIPPLQGLVADAVGIQLSYLVPAACYLYLTFYGIKGHEVVSALE
jgi:FHS family L-fucose permease-like MFS transporter